MENEPVLFPNYIKVVSNISRILFPYQYYNSHDTTSSIDNRIVIYLATDDDLIIDEIEKNNRVRVKNQKKEEIINDDHWRDHFRFVYLPIPRQEGKSKNFLNSEQRKNITGISSLLSFILFVSIYLIWPSIYYYWSPSDVYIPIQKHSSRCWWNLNYSHPVPSSSERTIQTWVESFSNYSTSNWNTDISYNPWDGKVTTGIATTLRKQIYWTRDWTQWNSGVEEGEPSSIVIDTLCWTLKQNSRIISLCSPTIEEEVI